MPVPTAKLIIDPANGFVEELTCDARGWRGQRNYRVDTDITEEAMLCPELPAIGSKWSAKLPTLQVKSYGPNVRLGGRDKGDGVGIGWSRVPVFYETPTNNTAKLPEPGNAHDAWTAWVPSVGTQKIYRGLERFYDSTGVVDGPIDNGNGADIFVGQFEARVTAFYPLAEVLPIRDWVRMSEVATINQYAMDLPRVYGTGRRLSFEKGELLYLGPGSIEAVGDWVRVEHILKAAQSWDKVWHPEDAQGRQTDLEVRDRLYEYADLRGLWRTR